MSIIYCERHSQKWDSDRLDYCPSCELEEPLKQETLCRTYCCFKKVNYLGEWCDECANEIMFEVERPDLNQGKP